MIHERDYVVRLIKQLADVLARVLRLALVDPIRARAELEAAAQEALNMELEPLELVDAASCAQLLGRLDKILLYASIVEAQAELDVLEAATFRARRTFLRALALCQAALVLNSTSSEARALTERIRARVESLSAP